MRLMEGEGEDEEAEEKAMAAIGILKTLDALILALEASPLILREVERAVLPLVVFVFEREVMDLYEEAFELIGTLLFCLKEVSDRMWQLFPMINALFKVDPLEYLEEILPTLDNYIAYGKEVFIKDIRMRMLLVEIVGMVMAAEEAREADRIRGMQILECMMLNLVGGIDDVLRTLTIAY